MRILLLALLLTGCKYNVPVSQFDSGIDELCRGGLQEYQGHQFYVHLMDSYGELYAQCDGRKACANDNAMWVIRGRKCQKYAAHEINHFLGNHWVDAHKE